MRTVSYLILYAQYPAQLLDNHLYEQINVKFLKRPILLSTQMLLIVRKSCTQVSKYR